MKKLELQNLDLSSLHEIKGGSLLQGRTFYCIFLNKDLENLAADMLVIDQSLGKIYVEKDMHISLLGDCSVAYKKMNRRMFQFCFTFRHFK